MTKYFLFRVGMFSLVSILLAWVLFSRTRRDKAMVQGEGSGQRYLPFLSTLLLPGFFIGLTVVAAPYYGLWESLEQVLALSFGIFLHISVYYLVLMLFLPTLRRRISSRACAMLWLIPNYLYLGTYGSMVPSRPLWVISVSQRLFSGLVLLWLIGFFSVLLWTISNHLIFRRRILRSANPVTDSRVLSLWQAEAAAANIPDSRYKLVTSSATATPLSIGLFRKTIRIVLPDRPYTDVELSLILRHELVHLCREDSANKLFLTFCTAVCWFNPLMWIAMRKSAEDLELSCDETVLLNAGEETRSLYASLLLKTAGENRGITTCLSASAGALRYRLGQVTKKRTVTSGALTAAVIFFLLSMTSGYVTLAFGDYRVEEVLFEDGAGFDDATLYGINTSLFEHNGFLQCRDEEALCAYLSELSLVKLGGAYAEPEEIPQLLLFFDTETCSAALRMEGQALTVIPLGKTDRKSAQYYIQEAVDWDYLSSLLLTYSIQDENLPFPPKITLFGDHSYMDFTGQVVQYSRNGQSQPRESWWDDDDAPGFVDLQETALRIDFSHTPKDGYRVEVTDLEGTILDSFSSRDLTDPGILPLDYPNACYTVFASFADERSSIDMAFTFTLESPGTS